MRRSRLLLSLLTIACMLLSFIPTTMAAERPNLNPASLQKASVTIDGVVLNADAFIVDGRTMVPLRAIFEALGATIEWNPDTWTVTATKGAKVIKLTVGETGAFIDKEPVALAVPPVLINSRTFVPLRFVSQALGYEVGWIAESWTATISTGGSCALTPFQKHVGTIQPGGETWGRCGSPHVVTGDFYVEGKDSPILTIEDGAVVRFAADAEVVVGKNAPGGLVVNGKEANPVVLTADTSGPQPGFWHGISFYNQTLINDSRLANMVIEYAGRREQGAIYVEGWEKLVEIQLNNVEIRNSQYAGLHLAYQARLRTGSSGLKIHDIVAAGTEGGFPIMTSGFGSHNLPRGEFKNNTVNTVNIVEGSAITVGTNTTWRNVSIPYAISSDLYVEGTAAPTLTIEPGVITLWAQNAGLYVGRGGPGYLVADAVARPEGGGEWFTRPEGGGEWKVDKAELDLGVQLANAKSLEPGCALCGKNRAIVFGAWEASPGRGAWDGINLYSGAGDKTRLVGSVIANGGQDGEFSAGLYAEAADGKAIRLQLTKSLITGAARSGMEFYGNVQLKPESTGNHFVQNGWPIRVFADFIGYLPAGQTFTENDLSAILVGASNSTWDAVTKSATWKNHGIPYQIGGTVYIGGTGRPTLTLEPGTEMLFGKGAGLSVGTSEGTGTLVAVGAAGKPIKFTSLAARAGAWAGIDFTGDAGAGNRLEYVIIEYATIAVTINDDMGAFIKNATIRNSSELGIYRGWGTEGTTYLMGLGNQFEGNAKDENRDE